MTAVPTPLPPGYPPDVAEIAVEAVPLCPVCSGGQRTHEAGGHDYELQTCRNSWEFWRCGRCSAVWLDPRPALETLGVIYPPTYYSYAEASLSPVVLRAKEFLARGKINRILRHGKSSPTSYLDVGCGDGLYLRQFEQSGVSPDRIYGLELSAVAVERLRAQGFQAFQRRVEDAVEIPAGGLDVITLLNVIEHVGDPRLTVRRIAEWLAPGGVFAIETVNTDALDARLFRKRWWGGYHIPRHWTLFNENNLRRLCEEAGLEVVDFGYAPGHAFWIYSLHHWARYNARRPAPRLAAFFDPLKGLPAVVLFAALDTVRRLFGARTSVMMMVVRKPDPYAAV